MTRISAFAVVLLPLIAAPSAHAESSGRYEAALSDGTRVEGDQLTGWHDHKAMPHLQGVRLHDTKRQLLWLRDRSLAPHSPSSDRHGFVEFVGQDRLVGRVVGMRPSAETNGLYVPAHLLAKPPQTPDGAGGEAIADVRILPGRIQRVVWQDTSRGRLQPGTLFLQDGRQVRFLRLRWREKSVVLLLEDETREVELSRIAEVHLPRVDPWQAYYQELAVLSPACRSRLMRFETTDGLIVTASQSWFRAVAYASPQAKRRAMDRLKRLDAEIKTVQAQREANQKRFHQVRAEHDRQMAAMAGQEKAVRQASEKATAQKRQSIDQLRKAAADQRAKKREQLQREYREAEEAMQKRLAGVSAAQRRETLKTFRREQMLARRKREKALDAERSEFNDRMRKELAKCASEQASKLRQHGKQLQARAGPLRRRLGQETGRWNRYLKHVESLRAQRASTPGENSRPDSWYHMVQPVWSLDPLWVPFRRIHTRWSFAPHQVPLARLYPAAIVSPALLPWHANRNSHGQLLRSAGREYGWGFNVHAHSELSFALPQCAVSFRSRVGLDSLAGAGGCVRTRVYVGSTKNKPVYEAPLLVGSEKTVDTGRIRIPWPSDGPKRLILQVDPANRNYPLGADPLNIRDMLDWLDPRLELDAGKLQDLVLRHVGEVLAASPGWTARLDKRGACTWTVHFDETAGAGAGRFLTTVWAQGQPLVLSREMTIGPTDKWLAVHVGLPTGEDPRPDVIALYVGQRKIQPRRIPTRQHWQSRAVGLLFPLEQYQGKKVSLELRQPPGEKPLHWRAARILTAAPAAYRLADILERAGRRDAQIPLRLGKILQSGQISDRRKRAVVEISQFGGLVNFTSKLAGEGLPDADGIANVMIGSD